METTWQRNASARSKHANEVYSSTRRKMTTLSNEYHCKVSHDFSRYVFFGKSSRHNESLDDAINMITSCQGYEAHRMINHKGQTSHFYIRFVDFSYAQEAVARIKQTKRDYVADTVDKMLLGWYLLEMSSGTFPWTLAIVDVVGKVEHTNPLSQDVLQGLLIQFGDPRIHSYEIGNHQVDHVQVLFSSMSEALGASIVFGCWYRKMDPENPRFYYRLKILSSNKEVNLLKKCVERPLNQTGNDLEALELDYFMPKVSNVSVDVPFDEPNMQYQDSNTFFMTQPGVSENIAPRPRPYRRQFSRGRSNTRNRVKTFDVQRNARNSRNVPTVPESEYLSSAVFVSNDFLTGVQPVP